MKKSLLLWLLAVVAHTYLFYNQGQGFNAPVFSLILVVLVGVNRRQLLTRSFWQLGALVHLVAAVSVAWHGTFWVQIMYFLSGMVLTGLTYAPNISLHLAWLNGLLAACLMGFVSQWPRFHAAIHLLAGYFLSRLPRVKASLYVMPFSITAGFYLLYCWANPDFWVDFSFLTIEIDYLFIGFILFGFVWLCPLFFPWGVSHIVEDDAQQSDVLTRIRLATRGTSPLALRDENQQGKLLFVLLNGLILTFLVFNCLQLFIPTWQQAPKGYSEQVHEGFYALIISILSAIGLIMYYFRNNQNFYGRKLRLVQLAVVWIVLNGLLAVFTFYKNSLYINTFGLTFKRIWVYIFLGLTLAGLVLTFVKINYLKTNWYLLRRNAWVAYIVIALYGWGDWDRLITWYNLNHAKHIDLNYLYGLGPTKLPYLQSLIRQNDSRLAGAEKKIAREIADRKATLRTESDWQSKNRDEIWLKETLK